MNNTTQKNEQQDYETNPNKTVREAFAIGYNTGYEHGQGLSLEPLAIAQDAIDLIKWFHGKATPEDTEEMNAAFDAGDFREFVDRHAALMCRMAQHKKNPTGQEVRIAELERELAEEKNHRLQAQKALMFWLPMVPSEPEEISNRAAHDARLLCCYEGDEEPSAEQLGWISLSRPSAIRAQAMPQLTVWYGPMPESNGKSNFTAILMRKDGDEWVNMTNGVTIARSEYPDRVRYEADRVRYLIGELSERPFILDYDADKHSGYIAKPEASSDKAVQDSFEEKFDRLAQAVHDAAVRVGIIKDGTPLSESQLAFMCAHFTGSNGGMGELTSGQIMDLVAKHEITGGLWSETRFTYKGLMKFASELRLALLQSAAPASDDESDMLTIAYLDGFHAGKKAAGHIANVRKMVEPEAAPAQTVAKPETEREKFEKWAGVQYRNADEYTARDFQLGLEAWQAAMSAEGSRG